MDPNGDWNLLQATQDLQTIDIDPNDWVSGVLATICTLCMLSLPLSRMESQRNTVIFAACMTALYALNPYNIWSIHGSTWKMWANAGNALVFVAVCLGFRRVAAVAFMAMCILQPYSTLVCACATITALTSDIRIGLQRATVASYFPRGVIEATLFAMLALVIYHSIAFPEFAHVSSIYSSISNNLPLSGMISQLSVVSPQFRLSTVAAGTPEPELNLYWYLFSSAFRRYSAYFSTIALGHPFIYVVPLIIRFRCQPDVLWFAQFGVAAIMDPTGAFTIQRVLLLLNMAMAFPDVIAQMRPMHVCLSFVAFSLVVSPALKYTWIHSLTGNANLLWIQQMVFTVSCMYCLIEFAGAAIRLQKAQRKSVSP